MHRTFGYFEEGEPKVLENSAKTFEKGSFWAAVLKPA